MGQLGNRRGVELTPVPVVTALSGVEPEMDSPVGTPLPIRTSLPTLISQLHISDSLAHAAEHTPRHGHSHGHSHADTGDGATGGADQVTDAAARDGEVEIGSWESSARLGSRGASSPEVQSLLADVAVKVSVAFGRH